MVAEVQYVSPTEALNELSQATITLPDQNTKIYKDECTYCFHTPFFEGGLFVCLQSYCCFCPKHIAMYAEKSGATLFVHVSSEKVAINETNESGEPLSKITKLAIGTEGGFENNQFEIVDKYYVVVFPHTSRYIHILPELGDEIYKAAHQVETCTSAERLEMLQNASNAWDGEIKLITKHVDMEQLKNGKIIPPSGWKCEADDCDLMENLWLNLTDGAIRCGRSQFLAEGKMSMGNNHMKQYFDATGYPLVVKLGTISGEDCADIYSYDEDEAVVDTNLRKHLAHFGLDMDKLKKTEKSTLEMELDLNQKWEWAKCVEDGACLDNIYGAGYTGLINIGSSCYMNSVVQALMLLPSIQRRFVDAADAEMSRLPVSEVHTNQNAQITRLFKAMMTDDYAKEGSVRNGIKPKQFKRVIAGHHPDFSTAQQQDAEEYLRYLVERISSNTPADAEDPTLALKFKMESRFEDVASGQVRYNDRDEMVLALPVREELMTPLQPKEGETELRFAVHLSHLIESAFSPNPIEGFKSPVTGEVKGASTTIRFKTFPDFLVIQIQKFALTHDYKVRKFDMDVEVEDTIDLNNLRGTGKQPNEVLLPEDAVTITASMPAFDKTIVPKLVDMGFTENAATKAAIEVHPRGGDAEQALNWLMEHIGDSTINDPVQPVANSNKKAAADRECVQQLVGFGFTVHQACYALDKHNQDVNQAAEWLFEHVDQVPAEDETPAPVSTTTAAPITLPDGHGNYKLVGMISHMGSSPHSGHYVAHLLKDDKWILFNDEKVAVSQNPPRQLAYLYLYQRQ